MVKLYFEAAPNPDEAPKQWKLRPQDAGEPASMEEVDLTPTHDDSGRRNESLELPDKALVYESGLERRESAHDPGYRTGNPDDIVHRERGVADAAGVKEAAIDMMRTNRDLHRAIRNEIGGKTLEAYADELNRPGNDIQFVSQHISEAIGGYPESHEVEAYLTRVLAGKEPLMPM